VQRELAAAMVGSAGSDLLLLIANRSVFDEVAVALDIPVGTVRSRLHRARRKTREALGGQDPTSLREELLNE
jgi:RNA polymerase sigma-70 factor (ECF subfamily)